MKSQAGEAWDAACAKADSAWTAAMKAARGLPAGAWVAACDEASEAWLAARLAARVERTKAVRSRWAREADERRVS